MRHFGIISPPVPGHINPFSALGRELVARGHRVTYLQLLDVEAKILTEGLDFAPIGESDHPRGSLPASLAALGSLQGWAALRFTIQAVARTSLAVCRDAPDVIRRAGIDSLLVDQMEPAGGAVADHLGIPFVTVCNALPLNRDASIPPPFTPWRFRDAAWARIRNRAGYRVSDWVTSPVTRVVADYRARWKLPPLNSPGDSFSPLVQICQMPRELDFPRSSLPPNFHYVGPIRDTAPPSVAFPWERLNGRPIVYASLGTLQNSREPLFRVFADACRGLDVQLVISHGGGLTDAQAAALSRTALVVPYAPQTELLAKASLTMTHGGLNTVLDSVASGVPLVMVPITYEQPAIARRVERAGVGSSIPLRQVNTRRVTEAAKALLTVETYRRAARQLSVATSRAGGVRKAADLILGTIAAAR